MRRFSIALAGAALALGTSPAAAQRDLLDVPASVTVLSKDDLEKAGPALDLSQLPLLELGKAVNVQGRFSDVTLSQAGSDPVRLQLRGGTGPDGTYLTNFEIPRTVRSGRIGLTFQPLDADGFTKDTIAYGFLNAWLEQDKLRSGQRARFGYDLDFGVGPGRVTLVVTTLGPIRYSKTGAVQTLTIGTDGKARFQDAIQALKGSPVGIPFAILPVFTNYQQLR